MTPTAPIDDQEAIDEEIKRRTEYELNMDTLPAVNHFWVDRGEVMSCENAGHPNHRHFKFNRGTR